MELNLRWSRRTFLGKLGRSQKVGKEEIVGLVKALVCYLTKVPEVLKAEWQKPCKLLWAMITPIRGVKVWYSVTDLANLVPCMEINRDAKEIVSTPKQVSQLRRDGEPSIVRVPGEHGDRMTMHTFILRPRANKIVAMQLVKVLKAHSG
jgi:hypothetical protein